jgi:predicted phosphodiesterase
MEGLRGNYDLLWQKVKPQVKVAIVAGDIDTHDFEKTVTEIAAKFKKVFVVFGNHEFYHKDIDWRPNKNLIPDNVTILDRTCEEYEGKVFMGCTLWTDLKNNDWFVAHAADKGINDFHAITANNGGTRFTAQMAYEKHLQEKAWLKLMIEQNRGKDIVIVTHFMPTMEVVHPKWRRMATEMLNYYFAANCDDIIEMCEAKAWVFGHTHDKRRMTVNGVPMYCNPLGYGGGKERHNNGDDFKNMIIKV